MLLYAYQTRSQAGHLPIPRSPLQVANLTLQKYFSKMGLHPVEV